MIEILCALVIACATASEPVLPQKSIVVDEAGVLSTSTKSFIRQQPSPKVVTVVVKDMGGVTIEEYSNDLFKKWGIGKKGVDDGILFVLAVKERKVRIEVGYGLEEKLTDAKSKVILLQARPFFAKGDYDNGVKTVVTEIRKVVQ